MEMVRRQFLKLSGMGLAATAAGLVADTFGAAVGGADAARAAPAVTVGGAAVRPPAVPLVVRNPYVSTWLCGTNLAGDWASSWDGYSTAVCGLVRIDGKTYVWCGTPDLRGVTSMTQTSLEVTATRTIFTFVAGGIRLVAEWFSPIEPGNVRLQSVPLGLLSVIVEPTDGKNHAVELYVDIAGGWASWNPTDEIVWQTSATESRHWTIKLAHPKPLTEHNQMAAFGQSVFSTPNSSSVSYEAGVSTAVRTAFVTAGALGNTVDKDFRPIDENAPVVALCRNLGTIEKGSELVSFSLGHCEETFGMKYLGKTVPPLWQSYWHSWQAMVDEFLHTAPGTRQRAQALDAKVTKAATAAGGADYSALCALALRQAYGACILVRGTNGRPLAFLKELSSGARISTVDILFDTCPVWLYLDPGYLAMLLEPLLTYSASGEWKEDYAPHSLGYWPNAHGNPPPPGAEPMPVQESAAMLIMAAGYAKEVPAATAKAFLEPYSALFTTWAELLQSQLPVPPAQLTTIDYLGKLAADTNLAVLGIIGLGAASQIFELLGNTAAATSWSSTAANLVSEWVKDATDASGTHLGEKMGVAGTWSNLCNAYWDTYLSTGLVPASVAGLQATFYESVLTKYGLGYGSIQETLGRVDQQLWTAAWLRGTPFSTSLVAAVVAYVDNTSYRVPFPDTYDVATGSYLKKHNWRGRPVVGGVFSLLSLPEASS